MNQNFYNFQLYVALAEREAELIRKKEQSWHEPVQWSRTSVVFRRSVAVVGRFLMSGGAVLQQFSGLGNPRVTAGIPCKNHLQERG